MTSRTSRTVALAVASAGVCALSACNLSALGTQQAAPSRAAAAASAPAAPPASAPPVQRVPAKVAPAPLVLRAVRTRAHGKILVDSTGRTLYASTKDGTNPSRSRCVGACAKVWPPLLVTAGALRVAGVDKTLVGTITRADGTQQVTLAGSPLYRFVKDRRPGDVKGRCTGGFVLAKQHGTSM